MALARSKPLLALFLALGPALAAVPALAAAGPSPTEIAVARRLFDEGKAAEDAAHFSEAAEKFRRAAAIKDTPGIRFHLARCEEERGALVEALVEYDRARELIDSGVKAGDVERILSAAREQVRLKVALLTLRLPEGVKGAELELDGKTLSLSVVGMPMPLNPGRHRLRAIAVGRTRFAREIDLGVGEARQLMLELPLAPTAAPHASSTTVALAASSPRRQSTNNASTAAGGASPPGRTVVLLGEGVLFVAGVTTGVAALAARGSANARYQQANDAVIRAVGGSDPDGTACRNDAARSQCDQLEQARKSRSRASFFATAGLVAAGASAVAIGLTYWLWPSQQGPRQIQARVTPLGFDFGISGRF